DKGEDNKHQELDDDDDELPVEECNIQAHNPAMILDPTTHIRRGTMRSQPIMLLVHFILGGKTDHL
ncbi:hypothetical protein FRC08_010756, partial [Ceratobasidium sp. 394]